MSKHCIICNEIIKEDYGRLTGTILKVCDENKQSQFLHVCSGCQKQDNWIEKAKVKGV